MSESVRGYNSMEQLLAFPMGLEVVLEFVVLGVVVDEVEKESREGGYLTLALWKVLEHYQKQMGRSLISSCDDEVGVFEVVQPLLELLSVLVFA